MSLYTLPPKGKNTSKNTCVGGLGSYPYFVHMRWSSVQSLPQRTAFAAKRHLGDPTKSQEVPIPAQQFCRETMVSSILDDEIYIYIMGRPNFRFLVLLKVVVPHVLMFSNLCPMFHRYNLSLNDHELFVLSKQILAATCPISKKTDCFKLNTLQTTMFQPIQTCQGFPI